MKSNIHISNKIEIHVHSYFILSVIGEMPEEGKEKMVSYSKVSNN